MSRKVATVRAMYDAYSRGDFEAAVQHVHPEVELRPALEPLEQIGVIRGRAEVKRFFEGLNLWEARRVEFEELIESGPRLLAVERWYVTGRDGIQLDFRITDVYTFRDGLIVRADGFRDRAEALDFIR